MQTGAAWPSSARVLRRSINFCNERNPYFDYVIGDLLYLLIAGFNLVYFILFTGELYLTSRNCL